MQILKAIGSIFKVQIKLSLGRPMFRFSLIAKPILYCLLLYFIYKGSSRNMTVVLLGSMTITLWSCLCFSSLGDIQRERDMGTFDKVYVTPIPFNLIILIKTLANTLIGASSIIIIIIIATLFLNVSVTIANIEAFSLAFIALILSFLSLSLLFSSFFSLSRDNMIWVGMMDYPLYILCGMVVPVSFLPNWIQPISFLLPSTQAIKLMNMAIVHANLNSAYLQYLMLNVLHSFIFVLLSWFVIRKLDKLMRVNNTGGLM